MIAFPSKSVLLLLSVFLWSRSSNKSRSPLLALAWVVPIPTVKRRSSASLSSSSQTRLAAQIHINPLIDTILPSKTVEIFSLVKELESQGDQVTSLCVGEPDFPPPKAILQAAAQALLDGDTKYTAVTGTAPLRKAISHDLKTRKGLDYNPTTEIVVANGAKQAVYQGILATVGVGDEVLIPAPYWPSYPEMVRLAGAEPIIVQTKADDGFLLTPAALRTALEENPKVKLLIFCNPSNPTGGVHDADRLQELAVVLNDFPQVLVLSDEIYERLCYTGTDCPSMATYLYDRTLLINGFSKAYAMTGFRLGYLAAPAPYARACTTLQSQFTSCASSISQAAGVAALQQVPEEELQLLFDEMKVKRDYVLSRLTNSNDMPHVFVAVPPQGAFYVLPDVSYYMQLSPEFDDVEFCKVLLQTHKLAIVPGSAFGAPGTVRISYATSMEELTIAMDKLQTYLQELLEKMS
jgi:aspartate/methionine/tyrosine aminotransferase